MQCKGKPLRCNSIRPEKRKILISRLIVPGHESETVTRTAEGGRGTIRRERLMRIPRLHFLPSYLAMVPLPVV